MPAHASKNLVFEETLDSPLTELHLIRELEEGRLYAFGRGEHPTLPTAIVAYAVAGFWQLVAPDSLTLTFDQIAYSSRSPGQAFKLSEDALATYLEAIEDATRGTFSFVRPQASANSIAEAESEKCRRSIYYLATMKPVPRGIRRD